MADVSKIADGLSGAQRRYLLSACRPRWGIADGAGRIYTYPPPNTHAVLIRLGLVDEGGKVSAKGLAVRTELQRRESGG